MICTFMHALYEINFKTIYTPTCTDFINFISTFPGGTGRYEIDEIKENK